MKKDTSDRMECFVFGVAAGILAFHVLVHLARAIALCF